MTASKHNNNMKGHWEPHSASIDFCETNYLHNEHMVEPHNVWSSVVGIAFFGVLGLGLSLLSQQQPSSPLSEWRVKLGFFTLIVIGVGSALLHGTLHWFFQSSDELPMIYIVLCLLYGCAEVNAKPGQAKYHWLAPLLMGVVVVNTIVYFKFQDLYHVFVLSFAFGTAVCVFWAVYLLYYKTEGKMEPSQTTKDIFKRTVISYVYFGSTTWILDMLLCHHYIDVVDGFQWPFKGITPHVAWHIASGFGAYCGIWSLACYRCECLGIPYQVDYMLFGIIPLVFLGNSKDDKLSSSSSSTTTKTSVAAKRPKAVKEQ